MNSSNLKPKIGIVSGIGPLAGSCVLAKVFEHAAAAYGAVEDCEYPDVIFVSHGIEGVDNIGTLSDAFEKEIISMVGQAEDQGATIIGIACNTAYTYLDKIKTKPETILVNLIDEVATEAAKSQDKYLLLTSAASKEQKLHHGYLKKHGVSFSETTQDVQKSLDDAIGLVMAHKLEGAGVLLDHVLLKAKTNGFSAIIAGCTELPIAIDHCKNKSNIKIIDSSQILAECLVAKYYNYVDRGEKP